MRTPRPSPAVLALILGAGALAGHFVASTLVSGGVQLADESLGTSVGRAA